MSAASASEVNGAIQMLLLLLVVFYTLVVEVQGLQIKTKITSKRGMARGPDRRTEWMTRGTAPH